MNWEIQNLVIDENDILVGFDVTSLLTNVPLQETMGTIADKAFVDSWFNVLVRKWELRLSKDERVSIK